MTGRRLLQLLLATVVIGAAAAGIAVAGAVHGNDTKFEYSIGVWGDMPYSDVQAQTGVPNLIDDMNSAQIEFSVHDGDLKAGNATPGSVTPTSCQNTTEPSIYSQGRGTSTRCATRPSSPRATTIGPTATGRRTAASTRWSGCSTSAGSSSPRTSRSASAS